MSHLNPLPPPPKEPLLGFHLCVALVCASICLIRGCSNVNKCCQMWKDRCPHMVSFSRWMKPGSPQGFWLRQPNAEVGFSGDVCGTVN